MRCNPWRWLWGLVPVALMGWAAVQIEHARIERDLTERGKEALVQAGFAWADLSFSGRDGALSGKAVEESEPARAMETVRDTWGIRAMRDFSGLIDKVDRYEWVAIRRENRIRLNGLVPNEQARRQVIGIVKASVPNLDVDDRLRLARGAPPTDIWLGGVGFGIKQLAQLKTGRVTLDVASLSVSGEAADVRSYRNLKAALRGVMPPGISLKQDGVTAPVVKPHVWSASRAGDLLTLAGHVPNDRIAADLLAAARDGASKLRVVDDAEPGEGEAEGWAGAAVAVVRTLAELEEGFAELRDAGLTLTGLAESDAAATAARGHLRQAVPGAFKVSAQIRVRAPVIPLVAPHITTVDLDAGALALSGHVPTPEAHQALLAHAAARLPAAPVRDSLQLGAGQQPGWQKCIEAGLDAVARLGNGRARLVDRKLEVSGRTRLEELAQSLPETLRGSVGAECETQARIALEPPPEPVLQWSAALADGELVLSGEIAGEETRGTLVRAAGELLAGARLTDRMSVVAQASQMWTRTARQGLALLARLRRGEARIDGPLLAISGEAADEAAQLAIRQALQQLPTGYRGSETVVVRAEQPPAPAVPVPMTSAIEPRASAEAARKVEVDVCQDMLGTIMRAGSIEFERGSAELDAESLPTLQRLAEVAAKCAKVRIEIAGHTDIEGDPRHNQRLSQRRAQAVVDYLSDAGVPGVRMHAIGFGFSRPLAPNTTQDNKARNRRIEFRVTAD